MTKTIDGFDYILDVLRRNNLIVMGWNMDVSFTGLVEFRVTVRKVSEKVDPDHVVAVLSAWETVRATMKDLKTVLVRVDPEIPLYVQTISKEIPDLLEERFTLHFTGSKYA